MSESSSAADRLRELKALHDEGLISDDEFAKMRAPVVEGLDLAGAPKSDDDLDELANAPAPEVTASVHEAAAKVKSSLESHDSAPVPPLKTGYVGGDLHEGVRQNRRGRKIVGVVVAVAVVAVIAVLALSFVLDRNGIEYWAFPERAAYDAGVGIYELRDEKGSEDWFSCEGLLIANEMVAQGADNEGMTDAMNEELYEMAGTLGDVLGSGWDAEHDIWVLAGYWDEAHRQCPEAFVERVIIGRP